MADLLPNAFIWTPFCPDLDQTIFKAGTYQVAYQTVGHLVSGRAGSQSGPILFVPNGRSDYLPIRSDALSLDACRSKWPEATKSIGFVEQNQIRCVFGDYLGVCRTRKVLFLSNGNLAPARGAHTPTPPPPPLRPSLKHFDARISSFTERNEISQRWP